MPQATHRRTAARGRGNVPVPGRRGRRQEDLRRIEQAITRIARIGNGKDAALIRARRSGVRVSRPGIAIMATLARGGELRVGDVARQTKLETPLVSRELHRLGTGGYVVRRSDPRDGRVAWVALSEKGRAAYRAYRSATDDIVAETFAGWRTDELHELAATLERVLADFARPPSDGPSGARSHARRHTPRGA